MAQADALGGDPKKAGGQLDQAGRFAAAAHSGSLNLQIRLERVRLALAAHDRAATKQLLQAFADDTAQLNEIPLRLQWLELEIAGALAANDKPRAASHCRQALALLAGVGSYANAATIHALGALALLSGTDAEVARSAAGAGAIICWRRRRLKLTLRWDCRWTADCARRRPMTIRIDTPMETAPRDQLESLLHEHRTLSTSSSRVKIISASSRVRCGACRKTNGAASRTSCTKASATTSPR